MSFVQVEAARREPEPPEGADAAAPEDDLLPDPMLAVAAVEAVGDRASRRAVLLQVGVEEVETRPADVGAPDPDGHRLARELQVDEERPAVGAALERQRQPGGVVQRVALALPPGLVERLPEVAALVEEADADE